MNNFLRNVGKSASEIAKTFSDIEVWKRGHCCNTCTLAEIKKEHYIVFKIYDTGMNRNAHLYRDGELEKAYISWNLENEQLQKICEILSKYFTVTVPKNENECIEIEYKRGVENVSK